MKSVTSFFDFHTFRKDVTRFAPLWLLYLIGGTLVMLAAMPSNSAYYTAENLIATISPFAIINIVYACIAAMLLFGDLFNSRLCNALHAMPLRREQWFISHLVAGIAFSVVPNLLGISLVMVMLEGYWYVGLIWLLGMTLHYLFFFGLAVFSVFCTGNRFAMAAVYALLNFASMLAVFFVSNIYEPLMFGIEIDYAPFNLLCPVVHLLENGGENIYVIWEQLSPGDMARGLLPNYYVFAGFSPGWTYLWIIAALGVVLLVVSLLLYRRRALESAGDFIAVRPLAPVFSIVYTLAVGAVCAAMEELITGEYGSFLIVGIIVGYFTGQMLLQRTVKVFRVKTFLKCGGILILLLISMGLTWLDPLGITRFVPNPDKVASVEVELDYGSDAPIVLTDPEDIRLITKVHQEYVDLGRQEDPGYGYSNKYITLELHYTMKNGATNNRVYSAVLSQASFDTLKELFSRPEHVMDYKSWEVFCSSVKAIYMNSDFYGDFRPLLEAIKADCEAGNMVQNWRFHPKNDDVTWIEIQRKSNANDYLQIRVYSDAVNTLKWLKDNGGRYMARLP